MGLLGYTVYKDLKTYDSRLSGHGVVNRYSDRECLGTCLYAGG
jgi:hypothetical protein